MTTYYVYCHTNLCNGKKYFGITSQLPKNRWKEGKGYINNQYFFRAIEKNGWDCFSHDILKSGLTKEQAEKLEIALIAQNKSNDPKYGYNIENGGNSTEKFTPEIRKKISDALKGHKCSKETRERISRSKFGIPSKAKGRKATEEQIEKNRKSHIGQKPWNLGREWTEEEKAMCGGKAVLCVETNRVYRSAHEASRELSIDFSSICKCRSGKSKTAGGFHWKEVQ